MDRVLERFDAVAVRRRFEEAGVLGVLQQRGFTEFEVTVEATGRALPHAMLFARKDGLRVQLLDACVGEATVRPDFFTRRGYTVDRPSPDVLPGVTLAQCTGETLTWKT